MSEVFPNAPLYEAVFQIRFAGELSVEVARAKIQDAVRSELPKLYVPRAKEGQALALQAVQLHSGDDTEMIGLAMNSFAYHTRRYAGYEAFQQRVRRFWAVFSEHVHVHQLVRVGLRYINHIPILRQNEDSPIPLRDYLNIGLDIPPSIRGDLIDFNTTLVERTDEGVLRIAIEHKKVEAPPSEMLLLDFDFAQKDGLLVSAVDEYLERAHRHTKRIFLELVSEKYLAVMRSAR